jgi:F-type H+-transporting ATPase subunit delta
MAEKTTIARPYAQAVFELAKAQGKLKAWSELLALSAAVAADPQIQNLLGDPRWGKEQLAKLFLELVGGPLDATGHNFIQVLIANRRLGLLPEIATLFEAERAVAEGTLEAQVISAYPLSEQQQAKIAATLQARYGRTVSITAHTDNSLLGGVLIRAGDSVIDGTARGQLAKLANALAQ